jgi:hypothetical protein
MVRVSKTTQIVFLVLFAIVLLLTGSLIINMYNVCADADKSKWTFHWWVGLGSILVGVVCVGYMIVIARQTNTGVFLEQKLNERLVSKKVPK